MMTLYKNAVSCYTDFMLHETDISHSTGLNGNSTFQESLKSTIPLFPSSVNYENTEPASPVSAGMAYNASRVSDVLHGHKKACVARPSVQNVGVGGSAAVTPCGNTLLCAVPAAVLTFLDNSLRKAQFRLFVYDNGDLAKHARATLGNKTYAYIRENRISSAVDFLLDTQNTCLFITLTLKYDSSMQGLIASWKSVQKLFQPFIRKLRSLGVDAYIAVKEAHKNGGCHMHLIVRFNRLLPSFDHNELNHNKEPVSISRLDDHALLNSIKSAWPGFVDVQVVKNASVGHYLTKELGKASHIEDALKRANRNWSRDGDESFRTRDCKKLWAVYFMKSLNIRGVSISRNIPLPPEPQEQDADLINSMNNSTQQKSSRTLIAVLPLDWSIKNQHWFNPFSGSVDKTSDEYRHLTDYLSSVKPFLFPAFSLGIKEKEAEVCL
jgi:hypothetical protein